MQMLITIYYGQLSCTQPEPTQPLFLLHSFFLRLKKGKDCFCFVNCFYGCFLSIKRANTMATMMIKTNKPAIAGTKYMSAADWGGVSVGAAVGCAALTAKAVTACDGQ
jgi:hypothetical protein